MFLTSIFEGWLPQLALVIVSLFAGFYLYSKHCYNYWEKRGIPYIEASFPFGSLKDVFFLKKSTHEFNSDVYKENKGKKYVGFYTFLMPQLLINDLDLIKNVLVKDFSNFVDRGFYHDEETDLLSGGLFSIEGQRWKSRRSKLSPTFTSGKLKTMYHTMKINADDLQKYAEKIIQNDSTVNCKDMASRYGLDVITNITLGLEGNNFVNDKTDLKVISDQVLAPTLKQLIRIFFVIFTSRKVCKFLRLRTTDKNVEDYFIQIMEQTMKYRQNNNVRRNDFFQLLMDMHESVKNENEDVQADGSSKKRNEVHLSLNEMAAEAFSFVMAGFETTSTTQSFCLYELALNQDIQEKLVDELRAAGADITYEELNQLPYLEMVLCETLRKYPVLPNLQRICKNDYTLPGGKVIEKDTIVIIPIAGLHKDPEYFPDPEKFNPERFDKENINNIIPFTYLPFGEGPRVCIGMRFAKLQLKLALYYILRRFKVDKCDKTQVPIKIEKKSFILNAEGGLYIRLTERQ